RVTGPNRRSRHSGARTRRPHRDGSRGPPPTARHRRNGPGSRAATPAVVTTPDPAPPPATCAFPAAVVPVAAAPATGPGARQPCWAGAPPDATAAVPPHAAC